MAAETPAAEAAPLGFPDDGTGKSPRAVAVIGAWRVAEGGHESLAARQFRLECCPAERLPLHNALARLQPAWLVLGEGIPEDQLARLLQVARDAARSARLAVIGVEEDFERANRWLRRGAAVYLASTCSPERAAAALCAAQDLDVTILDGCFSRGLLLHQAQMQLDLLDARSHLTARELQVLRQLRHGLRNGDIAEALRLRESTIEFHVSNIFNKLGVSNRTEAAQRAAELGL